MPPHHTFLIIGGAGCTGRKVGEILVRNYSATVSTIVLMGRTLSSLQAAVSNLRECVAASQQQPSVQVICEQVDATRTEDLKAVLRRVLSKRKEGDKGEEERPNSTLLVASAYVGTGPLEACIATKCHYIDICYNSTKMHAMQKFNQQVKESKIVCITDAGFHPGLLSVLVRNGHQDVPDLHSCTMGGMARIDWNSAFAADETVDEFMHELLHGKYRKYVKGKWEDCSMLSSSTLFPMSFSVTPKGKKEQLVPLYFDELGDVVPTIPSLKNCVFGMAGWGAFFDMVMLPSVLLTSYVTPQRFSRRYLIWSLRKFASSPPYRTLLRCEAADSQGKVQSVVELEHTDGYYFTAAAVIACFEQICDGTIHAAQDEESKLTAVKERNEDKERADRTSTCSNSGTCSGGILRMGMACEPKACLSCLDRLGVRVSCEKPS